MADIIDLLLADHQRILRLQAALGGAARYCHDPGSDWVLASVWDRLASLIEMHMDAEEEICYPAMFETGRTGLAKLDEAVADHEDVREAISEARLHSIGSATWWRAVQAALSTWAQQLDREEQGLLTDFARRADQAERDKLGRQWSAFIATRFGGLLPQAQYNGKVCQLCQWPTPDGHRHVIDAEHHAVLCTCPTCYELVQRTKNRQDHPKADARSGRAAADIHRLVHKAPAAPTLDRSATTKATT